MRYELKCDACGHDASEHEAAFGDEQMGCEATDSTGHTCICTVCSASLYAAECERLLGELEYKAKCRDADTDIICRLMNQRDDARAECERLRTIVRWAREFVAQEESAMGDVNDRTHAYQQLRTALDAGEMK